MPGAGSLAVVLGTTRVGAGRRRFNGGLPVAAVRAAARAIAGDGTEFGLQVP